MAPVPTHICTHSRIALFVIALVALDMALSLRTGTAAEMYWTGSFAPISLSPITSRTGAPEGSSTNELFLDGDVALSADNTSTAQLSESGGDTLVTEYALEFDGDGASESGAANVPYASYESFLSTPVLLSYTGADDRVSVTLRVRAQNPAGDLANAGNYSATQTITASWVGP